MSTRAMLRLREKLIVERDALESSRHLVDQERTHSAKTRRTDVWLRCSHLMHFGNWRFHLMQTIRPQLCNDLSEPRWSLDDLCIQKKVMHFPEIVHV